MFKGRTTVIYWYLMVKIEDYFDLLECRQIKKFIKYFDYINPLWEKLIISNKNILIFEVTSTIKLKKFNHQIIENNGNLTELLKLLKDIIFTIENNNFNNRDKINIYLLDDLLFSCLIWTNV